MSHKPESGQPVGIGNFYVLSSSTDKQPDVRLVVLYRFDDNEVTPHRIKIELR